MIFYFSKKKIIIIILINSSIPMVGRMIKGVNCKVSD